MLRYKGSAGSIQYHGGSWTEMFVFWCPTCSILYFLVSMVRKIGRVECKE